MTKAKILTHSSLTEFFYTNLDKVNKSSLCPLPQEFILYSSEVLNKYSMSETFFEAQNGKINEKILGMNFLQAGRESITKRKMIYQDVGDTVLVQLGFFPERINKKSPSKQYYIHLGKSAYMKMETLDCSFYDIPNFYNLFSSSLESIISVLRDASQACSFDTFEEYLLHKPEEEGLDKKKVS